MSAADIERLPNWVSERESAWNIDARAGSPIAEEECRAMVRTLIASRFHMASHVEQKVLPAYALTVDPKGSRLRETGPNDSGVALINGSPFQTVADKDPPHGISMMRLAAWLAGLPVVGRPVVDKTGLAGTYKFTLLFSTREDDGRPEIWTALREQLGLRLEPAKLPVQTLVVDHIERASPD